MKDLEKKVNVAGTQHSAKSVTVDSRVSENHSAVLNNSDQIEQVKKELVKTKADLMRKLDDETSERQRTQKQLKSTLEVSMTKQIEALSKSHTQ